MLKLIGYTVEERMTSGNLESIFKEKTIDEARRYVRKIIVSNYKEDFLVFVNILSFSVQDILRMGSSLFIG